MLIERLLRNGLLAFCIVAGAQLALLYLLEPLLATSELTWWIYDGFLELAYLPFAQLFGWLFPRHATFRNVALGMAAIGTAILVYSLLAAGMACALTALAARLRRNRRQPSRSAPAPEVESN